MFRWENFTTTNGLPDNHVYSVLVDGKRIWAGTDNGLGLYENGTWKVIRPGDGLAHQAILSLAVDKRTGGAEQHEETHSMRYLFLPEIELIAAQSGFEVIETGEWLTGKPLHEHSWSGYVAARATVSRS